MTQIIDGKKLQKEVLAGIRNEVASLSFVPVFCDVLVGEDMASKQYVNMKAKTAGTVGINFHNADFPVTITTEELIKEIKILNKISHMCGIIIQLPLPAHIDRRAVLDAIDPNLDVDCLGTVASEKFYNGKNINGIGFPTALACMIILDSLHMNLINKKIVVLGQGDLVGKPVTSLLNFRELNPEVVKSNTENKKEIIKQADVLISGMGNGKLITGDMVKEGVVLIDAGTSELSEEYSSDGLGNIVGDVDFESVKNIAGFVSPVPGGVGPVTVAMLLRNVLKVAKSIDKIRDDFVESKT